MRDPLHACRLPRAGALLSILGAAWLVSAIPAAAQDGEVAPVPQEAPAAAPRDAVAIDGTAGAGAQAGAGGAGGATSADSGAGAGGGGGSDGAGRARHGRAAPAKKRRGDINPCMTPDPGWGVYDPWSRDVTVGQLIMPHKGGIAKGGGFDVMIHFHGHEAVRKEFVKTAEGIVLVGIDLGIGSGAYGTAFSAPYVFERLLGSIERAMAKKTGKKNAHIRKLALSSWSAGYGAIDQILRQPAGKRVDALVLLDSLHAGYADEQQRTSRGTANAAPPLRLKTAQLEPFIGFARRAAAGEAFMFMSHSSIVPPGYASTTETADFIIQQLRGKPRGSSRKDVLGLDMVQRYDRGGFHVRGYTGEDKPDHCAHLGLMRDVVRVHLNPRWKSPRGRL